MTESSAELEAEAPQKRRSKSVIIALIAALGGIGLLASVQVWITITFFEGVAATPSLTVTGQKLHPSLTLISLAGIAAALVLTIAGRVFRMVIGGLVTLLGAGLAILGALTLVSPAEDAAQAVSEVTGISGDAQYGLVQSAVVSAWPTIGMLGGMLLALAGVGVLIWGPSWKIAGRKYEAATDTPARQPRSAQHPDRISDWDSLSDGDDPTDETDPEDGAAPTSVR